MYMLKINLFLHVYDTYDRYGLNAERAWGTRAGGS